jgi:hypothetical protein
VKVAAVAGSVLVAAGLVGAALAFRGGGSNASTATSESEAAPVGKGQGFPSPPAGAVVYAHEWGRYALALGVVPQRGQVLAQVSVVGTQGVGVSGLPISVNGHAAAACGEGCYSATLAGTPSSIDVRARSTQWHVALPARWPPRDASALLARAGRAWRALRSVSFHESLASDPTHSVVSAWRVEAPDRVAYQVAGGWAGIVVGERRWDRSPTSKRWVPSAQTRLTQPLPAWARVTDAHILGTRTFAGRPAWFTLAIDRKTDLTLDSHMTATSHFMHDVYGAFNTTSQISPPR